MTTDHKPPTDDEIREALAACEASKEMDFVDVQSYARALRELVKQRKILRELGKICEMGNAYEVLPDIVRHWKDAACRNIHLRAASEERVKKLEGTLRKIATSRHCQCGDAPSQYSRGMVDGCRLAAQAARDALADSPDAPAGEGD